MTLRCAIQLSIPDIIHRHEHPMTLSELVSALSISPDRSHFIQRLKRILVHSGFFAIQQRVDKEEEQDEGYVLALPSRLLLKSNPLNVSPMMLFISDPILIDPFQCLGKWLYHDNISTPFLEKNKQADIWEYAGQHSEINRLINDAMACDTPVVADAIINKCRAIFEGASSLVDVGGGTGELARAIAKEFSHLDCTVFDLPHVVKGLEGDLQNLSFEDGDMFVAIPSADVILLKWILHDWNDEKSLKILNHCKEALNQTGNIGKVIIIDMVIETANLKPKSFSETEMLMDLLMMVTVDGKERNEEDWARLFCNAGFSDYNIIPLVGSRSIIQVFP